MFEKHPILGNVKVEWKKCQTKNQACIWCGELMEKGYHEAMLTQEKNGKKVNLWVHAGCLYSLGEALTTSHPQMLCSRIKKNKSAGGIKCLHCDGAIRKNSRVITLDNSNDHIKMKKTIQLHEECAEEFGHSLKNPIVKH
mgnify:FL=1|tara:strand:- start:182 stop:601 length:420 start_codon:yes stop_codon:yes gene_type:complete